MAKHEGEEIRALLLLHGVSISRLGNACGVNWSGANYYLGQATLKPHAWQRCRDGLERLGIDWSSIRPAERAGPARAGSLQALQSDLAHFDSAQLVIIARLLVQDPPTQQRVLDFIGGILIARGQPSGRQAGRMAHEHPQVRPRKPGPKRRD